MSWAWYHHIEYSKARTNKSSLCMLGNFVNLLSQFPPMRQTYFRWFLEKPMSNSGLVRPEIFLIFSGFERATPTVTPAR
jgi:hypothetical protein